MDIRASEISSILKEQIKNFGKEAEVSEIGQVLSVGDGIARIYGLDKAAAGELLEFPHNIYGMVLNLEEDNDGAAVFGEAHEIKEGDEVRRTGRRIADQPVTLILADGSVHPAPGRFVFMDRAVDPKTGTLRVRAEFTNPNGNLRPGMFGRLRVDLGQRTNAITVPERALAELQGRHFVWIVTPEGTATQRTVQVGEKTGSRYLITGGLQPGERLVVEGLQKVREGAPVKAMTAQELAAAAEIGRAHV